MSINYDKFIKCEFWVCKIKRIWGKDMNFKFSAGGRDRGRSYAILLISLFL